MKIVKLFVPSLFVSLILLLPFLLFGWVRGNFWNLLAVIFVLVFIILYSSAYVLRPQKRISEQENKNAVTTPKTSKLRRCILDVLTAAKILLAFVGSGG